MPEKKLFFWGLAAWLLLFQFFGHCSFNFTETPSLFQWMYGAYDAPALDSSHGKLIPFVVLIVLWIKRNELLPVIGGIWWPGLILFAAALCLHVVGYVVQQPRLSIVSLFAGIYSLMGLAWGRRFLIATFFPFVLFVFSIPFGNMMEPVTLPLRILATQITYLATHGVMGLSVVKRGTQLFAADGSYNYDVAAACSGIRSLVSLLALNIVYASFTFKETWKRMVIISLALPLAILGNVFRLISIILGTEIFGQRAGDLIHEWSGFVTYAVAIGCVLLAGHWLERKGPAAVAWEAKTA